MKLFVAILCETTGDQDAWIFANGIQGQNLLTFSDAPLPLFAHFHYGYSGYRYDRHKLTAAISASSAAWSPVVGPPSSFFSVDCSGRRCTSLNSMSGVVLFFLLRRQFTPKEGESRSWDHCRISHKWPSESSSLVTTRYYTL